MSHCWEPLNLTLPKLPPCPTPQSEIHKGRPPHTHPCSFLSGRRAGSLVSGLSSLMKELSDLPISSPLGACFPEVQEIRTSDTRCEGSGDERTSTTLHICISLAVSFHICKGLFFARFRSSNPRAILRAPGTSHLYLQSQALLFFASWRWMLSLGPEPASHFWTEVWLFVDTTMC